MIETAAKLSIKLTFIDDPDLLASIPRHVIAQQYAKSIGQGTGIITVGVLSKFWKIGKHMVDHTSRGYI